MKNVARQVDSVTNVTLRLRVNFRYHNDRIRRARDVG
jgi:hypothetical protein